MQLSRLIIEDGMPDLEARDGVKKFTVEDPPEPEFDEVKEEDGHVPPRYHHLPAVRDLDLYIASGGTSDWPPNVQ